MINIDWIAGIIDGEGTFTIAIQERPYKDTTHIVFVPRILVGLKTETDDNAIRLIREFFGVGKVYVHERARSSAMTRWQTTTLDEGIDVGSQLLDHLVMKRQQCKDFIRACKMLKEKKRVGAIRMELGRAYDLETVLEVADIAVNMNAHRSKIRYSTFRTMDYWVPILTDLYGGTRSTIYTEAMKKEWRSMGGKALKPRKKAIVI